MPLPKVHLFICTNAAQTPGKCGSKNAEALRQQVKAKCASEEWGKDIRVNASGCLGQCEQGIAAVLYPKTKWLLDLNEKDNEFLVEEARKACADQA